MLISGKRTVFIKTKVSKREICPNCNSKRTSLISIVRKHVHLFWIPMFPLKKKGIVHCLNCHSVQFAKEMPMQVKLECDELMKEARGPLWQFSGSLLLVLFIIVISSSIQKDKQREREYLASPLTGDIYMYKVRVSEYSTMKVVAIADDSVYVIPNNKTVNKARKIYRIDKDENYIQSSFGMSKDELNFKYETNVIYSIDR